MAVWGGWGVLPQANGLVGRRQLLLLLTMLLTMLLLLLLPLLLRQLLLRLLLRLLQRLLLLLRLLLPGLLPPCRLHWDNGICRRRIRSLPDRYSWQLQALNTTMPATTCSNPTTVLGAIK